MHQGPLRTPASLPDRSSNFETDERSFPIQLHKGPAERGPFRMQPHRPDVRGGVRPWGRPVAAHPKSGQVQCKAAPTERGENETVSRTKSTLLMPLHLLLWTTLCGPGIPIGADGTLGSTFAAQIQHVKSDMPSPVTIRKGLDIRLKGGVQGASHTLPPSDRFSIHPTDFHSLIPRMAAKAGTQVKAGEVLFTDKKHPEVKFVSAISGNVQEPVRGEKRRILRVDVLAAGEGSVEHESLDPTNPDAEAVRSALLDRGFWPMLRQRPFDVMPAPDSTPRDIFVSGFDSAPLAPKASMVMEGRMDAFRAGCAYLNALLADGRKVQLGVEAGDDTFASVVEADLTPFSGPHPREMWAFTSTRCAP